MIDQLAGPEVSVGVVGNDDQAIYQWRGSDVANIVSFASPYPGVATFEITANRRSRPGIVAVANTFATTIPDRLVKTMTAVRDPSTTPDIVLWHAEDEGREAGWIAELSLDLADNGVAFRDRGAGANPSCLVVRQDSQASASRYPQSWLREQIPELAGVGLRP